ncbi:MAG: DUF1624 domain-containing protein [Bacteroidaceae bacterium]|nr:DUF1624 domain-containing protein [Bacteroidaceae bacterium]
MGARLRSLDILRGLTVALMILVNNGVGSPQFHQLQHSTWNGMTLCDLVFPFFLFMVGVSVWLSRKRLTPRKIVTRTLRLFLVGVLLHVWEQCLDGEWVFWPGLRLWGVLQRIALCYGATAFLIYYGKGRHLTMVAGGALVLYALLLYYGNGYAPDESNLLCRVDRWLVGEAHLYRKSPIDPEGLLGTLPAMAHTLIGVLVGKTLGSLKSLKSLGALGAAMTAAGLLLALWVPLNKRIWSPSYVLVTCGLATLLLLLLTGVERGKPSRPRFFASSLHKPFIAFGMNAFFLYVLSELLAPVVGHLGLNQTIYEAMLGSGFDPRMASLCYALLFDGCIALVAWALWKKQIFVKV